MAFAIVSSSRNLIMANGGTGTVTTNEVALAGIRWVSANAVQTDACKVADQGGAVIFESEATGAQWRDYIDLTHVEPFMGLQITTLSSGNVYFYLRAPRR